MKLNLTLPVIFSILLLAGCAVSSATRGTVAMKIDDKQAHICLGKGEVAVGDKITLSRNMCDDSPRVHVKSAGGQTRSCRLEAIGEGEVTEVLNNRYSVAKISADCPFEEEDLVELKK